MKLMVLFGIFTLIILIAFYLRKRSQIKMNTKSPPPTSAPIKIAHRGAAGYCPENTMASFKKAIELGADFIEIDVQLSRDGMLVVIHDPTLERTTNGSGYVRDHDFADLRKLDAGSWFGKNFKNEKIPVFEELLENVLPHTGILIELKNPSLYPGIEQKLADAILNKSLHLEKEPLIMVQSFDTDSVKRFHSLLPSLPAGVLIRHNPRGISDKRLKEFSAFAQFINPKQTMMTRRLKDRIHAHGMDAFTWTVNQQKQIHRFEIMKLDGVTTDYPDLFTEK